MGSNSPVVRMDVLVELRLFSMYRMDMRVFVLLWGVRVIACLLLFFYVIYSSLVYNEIFYGSFFVLELCSLYVSFVVERVRMSLQLQNVTISRIQMNQ